MALTDDEGEASSGDESGPWIPPLLEGSPAGTLAQILTSCAKKSSLARLHRGHQRCRQASRSPRQAKRSDKQRGLLAPHGKGAQRLKSQAAEACEKCSVPAVVLLDMTCLQRACFACGKTWASAPCPGCQTCKQKTVGTCKSKLDDDDVQIVMPKEVEAKARVPRRIHPVSILGQVVHRAAEHAWVRPFDAAAVPAYMRAGLGHPRCDGGESGDVYVEVDDVIDKELKLDAGIKVRFNLYKDRNGIGGCALMSA